MKEDGAIERFLQQYFLSPAPGPGQRQQLAALVQELINHDFYALVQVLYRVDVAEAKIRQVLETHAGTDSSLLIADLLLERVEEKRAARASFQKKDDIPDDEKW